MLAEAIRREAARLRTKYQTSDPYEICDALNIRVLQRPMGTQGHSCKGFFMTHARCKVIVLNSDLPFFVRRIILAHELGHACLHKSEAISAFHEFSYLDNSDRIEYEANIFAAEFLLQDSDVESVIELEYNIGQAASLLNVPPELLDFKLRYIPNEGNAVNAPYFAHGDFLKRDISRPMN